MKNLKNNARKIDGVITLKSDDEITLKKDLLELNKKIFPHFGSDWDVDNALFMTRHSLSRSLHYDNLYKKILDTPGVICEFGVRWGRTLAQLINSRGIYEPYNHSRKIYGFDTFDGFIDINPTDGLDSSKGDYSTKTNYLPELERVLSLHEACSPISHIKKFELIKGDASKTIDAWLKDNPHAIISMAIFDMDLYSPTKNVLKKIIPRLTKGSLLVFDELNCPNFPGETVALDEVLNINNISLRRSPYQAYSSWAVFGE